MMDNEPVIRGVGRPRQFDPDAVLDAIIDLYQTQGITNTTLADIERATGLVRTSLYHHFGSKDNLLAAVMRRYVDHVDHELIAPLVAGKRGLEDIADAVDLVASDLLKSGSVASCLIFSSTNELASKSCTSELSAKYLADVRAGFLAALARAAELEEIDLALVGQRSEILTGLVIGLHVQANAGVGRASLATAVEAVQAEIDGWREPALNG